MTLRSCSKLLYSLRDKKDVLFPDLVKYLCHGIACSNNNISLKLDSGLGSNGTKASDYQLQWLHNGCESVSNHQPRDCSLNRLFRRRSRKTPKLRVTGLCEWNSPGTREFPAQMASNAFDDVIMFQDDQVALKPYLTATSFQMRC